MSRIITLISVILILVPITFGKVLELTDLTFKERTENDGEIWLIEFYAPWCGHCKQLQPVFEQLSEQVPDSVKIGKVDATTSRKVATDHEVKAFPTIKYYRNNHWDKYEGSRTLDAFLSFVRRLEAPAREEVQSAEDLAEYDVSFLLQFPLRSPERAEILRTLDDTLIRLHGRAHIFTMETSAVKTPLFYRMHGTSFTKFMYVNARTEESELEKFVLDNNRPLVSKLENSNFKQLGSLGLVMMIAVADYSSSDSSALITKITEVAQQMTPDTRESIIFAHLDGIRYRKKMRHYNAMPGNILILDPEPDQYLIVKGDISETDLLNLANSINNDSLQLLQATPKTFLDKTWDKFVHYYPLSLIICLLPIVLVVAASAVKIPKKKKND